jgi:S-DNA-T family DNA segregation ATPase FtsK/SpoIIIE
VTEPIASTEVPFGLLDRPQAQARPAVVLDLAGRDRILVCGGPQSGRTAVVRTVAAALATGSARIRHSCIWWKPARGAVGLCPSPPLRRGSGAGGHRPVTSAGHLVDGRGRPPCQRPGRSAGPRASVDCCDHRRLGTPGEAVRSVGRRHPAAGPTPRRPPRGATRRIHVIVLGGPELLREKIASHCSRRYLLPFPDDDARRMCPAPGNRPPRPFPGRAVEAATRAPGSVRPGGTATSPRRSDVGTPGGAGNSAPPHLPADAGAGRLARTLGCGTLSPQPLS